MAMELGRRGCKVIVNYANSTESAEEVVAAIKKNGSDAACVKANVGVVEDIVRMFEEAVKIFGKLDIVCSNSGVVSFGHVKDVTPEEFDRVFTINTRGQFFVAREAYKHLEIGGRLILMGSITGQVGFFFSFLLLLSRLPSPTRNSEAHTDQISRCRPRLCPSTPSTQDQRVPSRHLLAAWLSVSSIPALWESDDRVLLALAVVAGDVAPEIRP